MTIYEVLVKVLHKKGFTIENVLPFLKCFIKSFKMVKHFSCYSYKTNNALYQQLSPV